MRRAAGEHIVRIARVPPALVRQRQVNAFSEDRTSEDEKDSLATESTEKCLGFLSSVSFVASVARRPACDLPELNGIERQVDARRALARRALCPVGNAGCSARNAVFTEVVSHHLIDLRNHP